MEQSIRQMQLRPASAKLVGRLILPLIDSGTITAPEYDIISKHLAYLAKNGEPQPAIPPKLITGQEAAEMLGIAYSQFRACERAGFFPFKRRMIGGKTVRFRLADIVSYINADDCDEIYRRNTTETHELMSNSSK